MPFSNPTSASVIQEWTEAAPFWDKHRSLISQMWSPVTQALIAAAGITEGHSILDVATGPGDPALNLAPIVGPTGQIIGIDPVPAMVTAARREATRLNLTNTRFEVAFADSLPFPDATFDSALSRFGVMFFPSPVDGIREILRVLKPAGKLALAVWHLPAQNPFFRVVENILDRYIPPNASNPDAPNSFRFATPGKLLNILKEAGVATPTEELLRFTMTVPGTLEDFWALRCEMSDKLRGLLDTLSPLQLAEVKHRSLQAARACGSANSLAFPAEVLILSGKKPA